MPAAARSNRYCSQDNDIIRLRFNEKIEKDSREDEYDPEIGLSCSGIRIVDDCINYIKGNLNEKITLEDLAAVCGRDKFHVIRTFRRALGTTPHAYIVEARVFRAAQLLRSGEPAAEVAFEVGFVDQSHLIRYFKRHVGTTPKRFVYQR